MKLFTLKSRGIVLALGVAAFPAFAGAQVVWLGDLGPQHSEADFSVIGSGANAKLEVVLTNLASDSNFATSGMTATDLLTGLFFQFDSGTYAGTLSSGGIGGGNHVDLTSGSHLYNPGLQPDPSNIDDGYSFGLQTFQSASLYGFGCMGFAGTGNSNFSNSTGRILDGGHGGYLIGPSNVDFAHDNSSVTNRFPIVVNSVTFTVDAPNLTFDELNSHMNDVRFAYGTAPEFVAGGGGGGAHKRFLTPEPVTSSLIGASALLFIRRRKRS